RIRMGRRRARGAWSGVGRASSPSQHATAPAAPVRLLRMSDGVKFVELPAVNVVGVRVTAPFAELFSAVPSAWQQVFARAAELEGRLDVGFVDCSLGEVDGLYTEVIGARVPAGFPAPAGRSEEHTSELQSREKLVCRLLLEKKNHE